MAFCPSCGVRKRRRQSICRDCGYEFLGTSETRNSLQTENKLTGILTAIMSSGAFIELPDGTTGFAEGNFKQHDLKIGQHVIVEIDRIERNGRVFLTIEFQEQHCYESATPTETIGNYLRENKNEILDVADLLLDVQSPRAIAKRIIKKLRD